MSAIDRIIASSKSAFYVLDIGVLKERIRFLRSHLPKNVCLCYAAKANPFLLRELSDDLEKFELCSPGEAEISRALGVDSKKTVISGIYKTPEFVEKIVADDAFEGVFTVESMTQYRLLCDLARRYDKKMRILLRLTNSSQFGINEEDIEEIIKDLKNQPTVACLGIQFFSGTQKTSIKKVRREIEALDLFLLRLKEELGFVTEELEYGPGFPVAYFSDDDFDEENYLSEFSEVLNAMASRPRIILELGRSIAASCGKYYAHVVDIKCNKGVPYAIVDGGMHHMVYFGQQMAMRHPKLSVVGKPVGEEGKEWMICGSLCSMNDIIAKQISLPNIAIGDLICFENTGAYCMMEGISLFLSRDLPPIYLLLENGEAVCIREPFETSVLNTPNYK